MLNYQILMFWFKIIRKSLIFGGLKNNSMTISAIMPRIIIFFITFGKFNKTKSL